MQIKIYLIVLLFSLIIVMSYSLYININSTNILTEPMNTSIELFTDSLQIQNYNSHIYQKKFLLKNTGNQSLIIRNVKTSCGCIVARYDKKPVGVGEMANVILEYTPNSLGYFSKTADVVCNISQGFVRITISGKVDEN